MRAIAKTLTRCVNINAVISCGVVRVTVLVKLDKSK